MRLRSSLGRVTVTAASLLAAGLGGCSTKGTCDGVGEMCRLAGTGEKVASLDSGLPALKTPLYDVTSVKRGPDGRVYVVNLNNYTLHAINANGTMDIVAGNGDHDPAIPEAFATASPLWDPIDLAFRADGRDILVQLHDPKLYEIGLDQKLHVIAGLGANSNPEGTTFCVGTGDGGPAMQAGFCELTSIAIDGKGRIYLGDDSAYQIRMIDTDGTISTLAGDGKLAPDSTYAYSGDGGPATKAQLSTPTALAIDLDGNLLFTDTGNHVVRKIDMTTGIITTVIGTHTDGFRGGFSGDDGPCLAAQMNQPAGVAVDTDGAIYVSDSYNERIRRVDPQTEVITTIAGTGAGGLAGDSGPAILAKLNHPERLSVSEGTLYIADRLASVARQIRLR